MTLSEKVQFIFLGHDFDFDTGTHALPGTFQQIGFQLAQAALGCSNQVINRRNACAHLGQHFLGGHTTIHQPDPLGFAVLLFDLAQELSQRGFVRSVAG